MKPTVRSLLLLAAALAAGCFVPREPGPAQDDRACTKCHGDPAREGDAARKAAPPTDTQGNTDVSYPGVGAHARHLEATDTHEAVACAECHRVPTSSGDEGHNDGVTQVLFGAVATRDGGLAASWNASAQRCTQSCHGATSGAWTQPRPASETCGTCHGLPPPSPHPQAGACEVCHDEVMASATVFRAKALHIDGVVQVRQTACGACHGEGDAGAPPRALDGGTAVTNPGVGAHQAHLAGGKWSNPVACATCHEVPATVATARHPNGGRAEVHAAVGYGEAAGTCATACHGGASPAWTTENATLGCASCHGAPPPVPHPQATACWLCHANSAQDGGFVDRTLHVNGTVDAQLPTGCTACHGSTNPAPPKDLAGNTDSSSPGVGAHQAHVVGRGRARVVECRECHVVPTAVVEPGHLDGVTQVRFVGVATANGATPTYAAATRTCANAACHDISNYTAAPGGGTATTPGWTLVDGSQATCGSCHGAPPPLPHPQGTLCYGCHANATPDGGFVRPELHINGRVEFALP